MSDAQMLSQALEQAKYKTPEGLAHQVRVYQALAAIALDELDQRRLCLHFNELEPRPKAPDYGRIMRGDFGGLK